MAMETEGIQDLLGANVPKDLNSLGAFLAGSLLTVRISVRRRGTKVLIPMRHAVDLLIVPDWYREATLSFLPSDTEKNLLRLEKAARDVVKKAGINGFVPRARYPFLKKEFNAKKEEYEKVCAQVVRDYDTILDNFRRNVISLVDQMQIEDEKKRILLEETMASIPPKEAFASGYGMELQVTQFQPMPESGMDEVSADMRKSWRDTVLSAAAGCVEDVVQEAMELLATACNTMVKTGQAGSKTIGAIGRLAEDLSWKNVFENPYLKELEDILRDIGALSGDDRLAALEGALGSCWRYAISHHLELNLDKLPYTASELRRLARG